MSKLSDNESSSESSSNEFLVPADQLDLTSAFFQKQPKIKSNLNLKTKKKKQSQSNIVINESSDDEFDDSQISSAELLCQVLKNLEDAESGCILNAENFTKPSTTSSYSSTALLVTEALSREINDLLLLGESKPAVDKLGIEVSVDHVEKQQDALQWRNIKTEDNNAITEKGVQIHLPGESLMFNKKSKKQQDLQKILQSKLNKKIRTTQMYIHKVGLLCWLAYGFYLNKVANDPDLLGIALSLVSPQNYPNNRPDLKYLEKFTKWFGSLFKVCDDSKDVVFTKDLLLERLTSKKIYNYIEMILIYIATLRGMGINSRLVISLEPLPMRPRQEQLIKIPTSTENHIKLIKEEDKKAVNNEGAKDNLAVNFSLKKNTKKIEEEKILTKKRTAERVPLMRVQTVSESKKIISTKHQIYKTMQENNREVANEEAKKKAIAILKKKAANSLKDCKVVLKRSKISSDAERASESNKNISIKKQNNKLVDLGQSATKIRNEEIVYEECLKNNEYKKESINRRNKQAVNNAKKSNKKSYNIISNYSIKKKNETSISIANKLSLGVKDKKCKNSASISESINQNIFIDMEENNKKKFLSNKMIEEVDCTSTTTQKISSKNKFLSFNEFEESKPKSKSHNSSVTNKVSTSVMKQNLDKSIKSNFSYKSKNIKKLISSDDESPEIYKKGYNVWVEVYLEHEESWISVDVLDQKIHCVTQHYKKANHPVLYIIAWNSSGTLKDVTRRYCPHWLTDTRKKRVDEKWWSETLLNWEEKNSIMSRVENEQLLQKELEQPLPKTLSMCKGHPLYVLQRHLLKFEALYPSDVVPLGHLKTGEAIYSRHCVHTLYSRETWIKRARVVKPAQIAYKIVKAMPKYDKLSGQKIKDQPLELFGKWQTIPYEPPEAKDGKVPRNEYGNVDLFKMCMLPKGCVYVDLPALNRIARKLNIDCAPACVGFNFGCRGALPAFQGFVVCQEYEYIVRKAWEEEQVLVQKRAKDKREKKIYGNWRKLIKGLLVKEKLSAKYKFRDEEENKNNDVKLTITQKNSTKPVINKKKRVRSKQESSSPRKKLRK